MYFSVKKKRKKEKVSFMVSLPHHFNPVMGREILHFPSLFQSIFTLLCCALPVSHWHTNTRLKRMWSSCKKTRVEWPFFMLIPTERARIYARTEGRGFVQIDQRTFANTQTHFCCFACAHPTTTTTLDYPSSRCYLSIAAFHYYGVTHPLDHLFNFTMLKRKNW